jgi:hypothetical protein
VGYLPNQSKDGRGTDYSSFMFVRFGYVGPKTVLHPFEGKFGTGQAERYFSLGLSLLIYF